jgi:6,7-dimethyl-8-ribityllumazine synthase
MHNLKIIESKLLAKAFKFAIVTTRFNDFIVKHLLDGAVSQLTQHDVPLDHLTLVKVPGCHEMPLIVKQLAQSKKYAGIICLGAIIKGDTHHFELLANETAKSLTQLMLDYNTPISFGILTTYNIEQAIARAGNKSGNKGSQAANACLEMANLMLNLSQ